MALLMVQEGVQSLGQFDAYAGFAPVGGEVGVLSSTGTDANGYQHVAVRGATTGDTSPFVLVDDGSTGYGLLFGNTVVMTDTGFSSGSDTATRLGPATYKASGKLTCWDKPGLYAVTLDALHDAESAYKAALPGASLTVDPTTSKLKLGSPASGKFAWVVSYKVNEALVTTGGAVVNHKKLLVAFNGYASATI